MLSIIAGSIHGWAVGGSRGIEEIQTHTQRALAVRTPIFTDSCIFLAEACREQRRTEEALSAVQAGFDASNETRIYDHRLHRERGEILLQRGADDEAERCFRRALEIIRGWELKSYELRSATSLARLLRDRGERDGARALLAPVYDWFTEGFDTADLKDAKALLEELA